jgi:hypothetical protein
LLSYRVFSAFWGTFRAIETEIGVTDNSGDLKLSATGLLLLLLAATMLLFADAGPPHPSSAQSNAIYRGFVE